VVLVWVSKDGLETRLYAREFYQELMSATLRRAREADRDAVDDLHRVRIPISFGDSDEHTSDLLDWMRQRCNADPAEYAARKTELNRSLGYDDDRFVGSFTFAASEVQGLIDHSVGLRPTFEVERIELREQRFSIPARTPIVEGRPAWFSLKVHPRKASLTFRGANGYEAIFHGEFRSMNLPRLGDDYHRATFSSPCVKGTIRGRGPFDLRYDFSYRLRQSLGELRSQVAFYLASRSSVAMTLSVAGVGPLEMLPVTIPAQQDSWHDWFHRMLELISTVPRRADRPMLSLDDLGLQSQAVERFAVGLAEGVVTLQVTLSGEPQQIGQARCLMYYAALECGNSSFAYIAARPCISQERIDDLLSFRFGEPVLLEHWARRGPLSRHIARLRKRFELLVARSGRGTATVADGDWMQLDEGDANMTTD
jgi:hypothetical protein